MGLAVLAGVKWLRSVFTCTGPRIVNANGPRMTMARQSLFSRLAEAHLGSTTKKSQDGRATSFSTHRFPLEEGEGGGNAGNPGKTSTTSCITPRRIRPPESSAAEFFHSDFPSMKLSEILNSSPHVLALIVCLRSMSRQEVRRMLFFAESTRCCSHRLSDEIDCLRSGFGVDPFSRLGMQ